MKFQITNSEDPVFNGAIAGIIAGIIQSAFCVIVNTLHISEKTCLNYAQVVILKQQTVTSVFNWIGFFAHVINAGFWGVIFYFLMKQGNKKYYIFKGIGLGCFIWMFELSLALMFRFPMFDILSNREAWILLLSSSTWGLLMSLIYRYLDRRLMNDPCSLEGCH